VSSTAKSRAEKRIDGYPPPQLADYLEKKLPITEVPIDTTPRQPVVASVAPTAE
jgi:hypothetical protein